MTDNDNGDRSFAANVEIRDGLLVISFARPTTRLVFTAQIARVFAACLLVRAEEMEGLRLEDLSAHPYNLDGGRHEQN